MENGPRRDLPQADQPTPAEQNYLKAIHRLGGSDKKVPTQEIADLLQVTAPSVTGMLKRLKKAGWISYESHGGASLTQVGIIKARLVIRRHRLLELLLTRVLGLDWSEVDAEAEALEHVVSPRLEQALAECLGEPTEDPHGHPIPTREGVLQQRHLQPLCDFCPGQWVLIREADDGNPDWLRHWKALGLLPGTTVRFLSYQPLDGVVELQVGSAIVPTSRAGLARLFGEAAAPLEEVKAA